MCIPESRTGWATESWAFTHDSNEVMVESDVNFVYKVFSKMKINESLLRVSFSILETAKFSIKK